MSCLRFLHDPAGVTRGAVLALSAAVGALTLTGGENTLADSVWVGTNPAKTLERKNMKIEGLTADGLLFRSATADRVAEPRPLKEIYRIAVDDEPALNAAETAFVGEKWDDAVAAYQKTLNTTRKDWVKQYATTRMIAAAEKSGKFPPAVSAFAALAQRDPKAADSAQPDVSKASKADLPGAINTIKSALGAQDLKPAQKQVLQTFLGELYVANGQLKEAEAISGKAATPAGGAAAVSASPAAAARAVDAGQSRTAAPAVPAANKGQVDLKLQLAQAAIKQRKFKDAIDAINSVASSIVEPNDQADALFALAEAKAGLAGDDSAKLQDASLAFMRVVAHFKGKPDAPHVADSLLRAGQLLEQAKMLPDALAAYQSLQTDYKDGPQAKEAAAAAARVRKAIDAGAGGKAG